MERKSCYEKSSLILNSLSNIKAKELALHFLCLMFLGNIDIIPNQ